ncbi:hypothetical protein [Alkalicoccobacillus murimartini]|uniref:UDP-N-acetylmuramyl pentapeptide phosphotransferase/UDP-N-acetylglucosamine-1-phosphate transferase n=1 Tax=Alkalicoccobacillus murimartini TaxID=171685 RepID=A0ABT9YN61_9BACI|nr:hypothetical protein [Alkalicoccobacillus murimartini]MDQ0208920.1 UDP-N-acetylmuramyl pentapeptide phosphotransferase/UDP-N-acetylglucosamine-1-phosphate transferase [Alkalicoccobacillus murimartini]
MILLMLTIPIIAFTSMCAFYEAKWTVPNYEQRTLPYSLGVVVVYGYAVMCAFPPSDSVVFSYLSLGYVLGIWIIGFVDDRYGKSQPKGIRGHVQLLIQDRTWTTGLIKAVGTIVLAGVYTFFSQPQSATTSIFMFLLLCLLPHVMNLFDTRPLRVWKISLLASAVIVAFMPLPSFSTLLYVLTIFYLVYVLEGEKKAILGDNGATSCGAIIAIWLTHEGTSELQWFSAVILFLLLLTAERVSFSEWIAKRRVLRWMDGLGVVKKS